MQGMPQIQVPIPEHISIQFTEIAQGVRLSWRMMQSVGTPLPGSNFFDLEKQFPNSLVFSRAKHYILAAHEHLVMWADFAAPFKFHPKQTTIFTLRPTLALARAALESAAQAVWLLDTTDPLELLRRHLCLVRWDLEEHRKSQSDQAKKDLIRERDAAIVRETSALFTEAQIKPPHGYLWIIKNACHASDLQLNADCVESLWRAASGAAHGMYWPNEELTIDQVKGASREPQSFASQIPDPDVMINVLRASDTMATYAALRYLDFAGEDITALMLDARVWLAGEITPREGADPEILQRLRTKD